jgi:hypothetical protein
MCVCLQVKNSTTRNLHRLASAIRFIQLLFERLVSGIKPAAAAAAAAAQAADAAHVEVVTLREAASSAYEEALAPIHTTIVRVSPGPHHCARHQPAAVRCGRCVWWHVLWQKRWSRSCVAVVRDRPPLCCCAAGRGARRHADAAQQGAVHGVYRCVCPCLTQQHFQATCCRLCVRACLAHDLHQATGTAEPYGRSLASSCTPCVASAHLCCARVHAWHSAFCLSGSGGP